jgi:hypothetical protein
MKFVKGVVKINSSSSNLKITEEVLEDFTEIMKEQKNIDLFIRYIESNKMKFIYPPGTFTIPLKKN